ncbi:MAG TPA: protein kinase [Vicinamibacterales bacterium]|nr:protein kinase [Vicinamibacterales bacterium]
MRLQPGQTLGPYRIVSLVGAGGMGEVYRARDDRLGRDVAVKVITGAADEEQQARFEREARATAALSHPNIVTIFDVGTHEGRPYLVTELLEGQSLREVLAGGKPLEMSRAVGLGLQLARGIAAAHAVHIVHRDLKPDNLFVTRSGTLKILDFGLAKLRPETNRATDTTRFATDEGSVVGTAAYMAPEQLRGEPLDARADIFAIGATLFEMVSGAGPFRRPSVVETMAAVLHDPPATLPAHLVPGGLARVIQRCLAKDPADRFQNASDLAFALESFSDEREKPAAPEPRAAQAGVSIAVLPFADMSATRDQDWLCDGLADELINALSRVDGLRVAARSSSFLFRSSGTDIQAAGAKLGVATVLEGGVRRVGDRLRITVQLVEVATGYQRWSERFDREVADVFAIQDEIAERVATALRGILTPSERKALRRPETAVECYEYFLRGRQRQHQFQKATLDQAKTMFERAIEIDPNYAPAWAGLADTYSWFFEWWGSREADLEAADRASLRALELAPDLAESHASRGFVLSARREYDAAAREFEEASRLSSNLFEAYYLYGRTAFAAGRIEQSVELFGKAGDVRREDFQTLALMAQSLDMLGRHEEAVIATREGIRRAERQLDLDPNDARALSMGAGMLLRDGQGDRARQWSQRSLEMHPDDQGVLVNAVCFHALTGQKDAAIDLLQKTFARGYGKRDWIMHDPDYDSLRDDPRFQALVAKLK